MGSRSSLSSTTRRYSCIVPASRTKAASGARDAGADSQCSVGSVTPPTSPAATGPRIRLWQAPFHSQSKQKRGGWMSRPAGFFLAAAIMPTTRSAPRGRAVRSAVLLRGVALAAEPAVSRVIHLRSPFARSCARIAQSNFKPIALMTVVQCATCSLTNCSAFSGVESIFGSNPDAM